MTSRLPKQPELRFVGETSLLNDHHASAPALTVEYDWTFPERAPQARANPPRLSSQSDRHSLPGREAGQQLGVGVSARRARARLWRRRDGEDVLA